MNDKTEISIGGFYETEDGRVARTYGWNGGTRSVSYHLEGGERRSVSEADLLAGWKRRADLKDFPDALDPRLPYEFDLFWDAKLRSDLPRLLAGGEDEADIRAAMDRNGMTLTAAEAAEVDRIRDEEAGLGTGPSL